MSPFQGHPSSVSGCFCEPFSGSSKVPLKGCILDMRGHKRPPCNYAAQDGGIYASTCSPNEGSNHHCGIVSRKVLGVFDNKPNSPVQESGHSDAKCCKRIRRSGAGRKCAIASMPKFALVVSRCSLFFCVAEFTSNTWVKCQRMAHYKCHGHLAFRSSQVSRSIRAEVFTA